MPASPRKTDVSKAIDSLEVRNIELKPPEDEQEKALRLHKEKVSFYIKDLGAWIFGFLFLLMLSGYCFWVLFGGSSTPADKEFAKSSIAPIATALLGFMLGKATK
jgi:hypothetical protein